MHSTMALHELIEAAVRSGAPERAAAAALAELRPRAAGSPSTKLRTMQLF
jgi:hypothetical protein